MKGYLKSAIIAILLSLVNASYAYNKCGVITKPFPFVNVILNGGCVLQAGYSFRDNNGDTHPVIICYYISSDGANQNVSMIWPYKNAKQSALMPVLIKINPIYEGNFADFSGVLSVHNNSSVQIQASCQYAY